MEMARLSNGYGKQAQHRATAEGLHAHTKERGTGEGVVPGVDRAEGPSKGGANQRACPERVNAFGVAKVLRTNEQSHARKSQQESSHDAWCRTRAPWAQPVHQNHPQGDGSDQQSGDSRGDG